jgi:hypothetical protein
MEEAAMFGACARYIKSFANWLSSFIRTSSLTIAFTKTDHKNIHECGGRRLETTTESQTRMETGDPTSPCFENDLYVWEGLSKKATIASHIRGVEGLIIHNPHTSERRSYPATPHIKAHSN